MKSRINKLKTHYNPDHDLFDQSIQMNYIDSRLLDFIEELHERVRKLEAQVKNLRAESMFGDDDVY